MAAIERTRLLRPPAIVRNVGAIYPRNRLGLDAARGALQCVVWNIDIENSLVTFNAIINGPSTIVSRNGRPDESKWQGDNI